MTRSSPSSTCVLLSLSRSPYPLHPSLTATDCFHLESGTSSLATRPSAGPGQTSRSTSVGRPSPSISSSIQISALTIHTCILMTSADIYQAFNGQDKLSQAEHMSTMCARTADIVEASKNFTVIVGEWSLGTKTYCVDYQSQCMPRLRLISASNVMATVLTQGGVPLCVQLASRRRWSKTSTRRSRSRSSRRSTGRSRRTSTRARQGGVSSCSLPLPLSPLPSNRT